MQTDRRRNHQLLGDVHLEETLGKRFAENVGKRRVGNFGIQCDDTFIGSANGFQGIAISFAARDFFAQRVFGEFNRVTSSTRCRSFGLLHFDNQVVFAAQFFNRRSGLLFVQRFAVPARLIRGERDAVTFFGFGDDAKRQIGVLRRAKRVAHFVEIVSVDFNRVPAESARASGVSARIPAQHGFAALTQTVHVDDGDHTLQLQFARSRKRFPNRTFGHFAVAQNRPDFEIAAIQMTGQCIANANGQTLTK